MTLAELFRWAGRLTGSFVIGLVLVLLFSADSSMLLFGEPAVLVQLACMAGVVAGIIVAWRNESLGGSVILLSLALFYGAQVVFYQTVPGGWVIPFMILPGLLFKASHWLRGRRRG